MTTNYQCNIHTRTAAMATLEGLNRQPLRYKKEVVSADTQRMRNINMLVQLMATPGALTAEAKARAARTIENLRSQL